MMNKFMQKKVLNTFLTFKCDNETHMIINLILIFQTIQINYFCNHSTITVLLTVIGNEIMLNNKNIFSLLFLFPFVWCVLRLHTTKLFG